MYSTPDFNQLLEQSRNPHVFAEHILIQLTAYYLNCNINIILPQSRPTDPYITIQALAISQPALYLVNVYDDNFPDHFQSVIPTDKPIDFEGIFSMFNGNIQSATGLEINEKNFPELSPPPIKKQKMGKTKSRSQMWRDKQGLLKKAEMNKKNKLAMSQSRKNMTTEDKAAVNAKNRYAKSHYRESMTQEDKADMKAKDRLAKSQYR